MNYRQSVYDSIEKEYKKRKALRCSKCCFLVEGKCTQKTCALEYKKGISNGDTNCRAKKFERGRIQSEN